MLDLAISADEKLLKVPLDPLQAHDAGLLLFHPLPHGLGLVTVHVGLAEDGEGDAVVELAEALDVIVAAGVLAAELVAWETDDLKVRVGGLEFCERCSLVRAKQ